MPGWKSQARHFGIVSARSLSKAAGDLTPPENAPIMSHRRKEAADICLNCKKKECTGSQNCFKRQKKEQVAHE